MKKGSLLVSFLICLLLLPTVCEGATKWRTLKTEHFTLFYPAELADEAWEVLQTLEYYRPRIEQLTGNRRQHLPVVLNDHGVTANGMANPVYNQIHLYWYPPRAGSIGTVEDWYTLVAIHEYTHILQMTNVGGGAKVLCSVVGDILSPNLWVPDWIIEGIAVYTESQLSSFQGRLNDGLYDAYIGARVADGRFPKILDATFSPHEFQLDGIYTYGGLFLEYLAQTYGEEKLTEFFNRRGSSILASFDAHAKTVFGKSFPQLWEDWKAYETKRFKDFAIDGVPVTTKGWYTAHPTLAAGEEGERMLFYQRLIPVKTGTGSSFYRREIIARNLDTGVEKVVLSSTASLNLPIKIWNNDKLYYGVEEIKPGYDNVIDFSYGMISQIREKDLRTGKDRLVLAGEIRAYDLLPDGRILYACATRNRFGSQRLAWWSGWASSPIQAVISPARATIWHQILFWSNPCNGRFVRPVSFALRILSSQRARHRCRTSRSANWPRVVLVANPVNRYPSTSSKRNCAPGWGRSRRTMIRIPGGQPVRSSSPVNSATSAPARGSPSAL